MRGQNDQMPRCSSQRARCAPTLEKDPQPMALIFGKVFVKEEFSFALTNGVLIFQRRRHCKAARMSLRFKLRNSPLMICECDAPVPKPPQDVPDGDPQAPYATALRNAARE